MEYKNAITLLDAMIGWETVGEQQDKPKSPHCRTHLEAVLGAQSLNVNTWTKEPYGDLDGLETIANYLGDVAETIKTAVQAKKSK